MNADLKQFFSFLFPCVQHYTKHGLQTHRLNTNEFSTVYFWYHMLHIKCIFNQWIQVLHRERGNRCCSCGGVALYDPSWEEDLGVSPGRQEGNIIRARYVYSRGLFIASAATMKGPDKQIQTCANDSYLDFPHSRLSVHGSNEHRDFCVTIYI